MSDIRKDLHKIFKKPIILNEEKIEEEGWEDTVDAIKKGYDKGRNIAKNPVKHLITNPIKNGFKKFAKQLLDPKKKRVPGTGHTTHHPVSPSTPAPTITNNPSPHVGGTALPPIPASSTPTTTIQPTNKPKTSSAPTPSNKPAASALPPVPLPVISPVKSSPPAATSSPVALPTIPAPSNNTPPPVPTNPSPELEPAAKTSTDDITKSTTGETPPSEAERLKNRWDAIDALVPWRTRTKDQYEHPHPAEIKYKDDKGFQSDLADIEKRWGKGPEATPQDLAMKPATKPYSRPASSSDIDNDPTKTIQPTNIPQEPETDDDNFWTHHDANRFDRVFSASDVVLNPKGIELQGIEDPKQKEMKILAPIKTLLINKNRGNKKTLANLKRKYGITSEDPITEISEKDPNDKGRKTVIKGIFANSFYKNCYENMLENLRKMNIISESKLDYGVFKQCAILAVNKAKQQYERRYSLTHKKVNNLDANEKQAESGAKNASKLFLNDIKEIYDNNRENFAMSRLEENVKFAQYFTEAHRVAPISMVITEAEVDKAGVDAKKEDDTIRINDYVWWIDQQEMSNIVNSTDKRSQLQYEGKKIQFVPDVNGKYFSGTSATIQMVDGPKKGEQEKVDIRNLDVPKTLAKTLIKFGKVVEDNSDSKIDGLMNKLNLVKQQLKKGGDLNRSIALKAEADKIEIEIDHIEKGYLVNKVNIQLFVAKDPDNIDKTLSSGGTKITPDVKNTKTVEVNIKELTKLNKNGKSKLLSLLTKSAIAIGFLVGVGKFSIDILTKGVHALGDKNITGSKHETNF
jgi:hypothetical protein